MHQNRLFLFLLGILLLVSAFYGWRFVGKWAHYLQLDGQKPVQAINWEIQQVDEDHYSLVADYRFVVEELIYGGQTIDRQILRNPWSAQKRLDELQAREWSVWYQLKNPQISSLYKVFPMKEALSAALLLLITLYFVGLGIWLGTYSKPL